MYYILWCVAGGPLALEVAPPAPAAGSPLHRPFIARSASPPGSASLSGGRGAGGRAPSPAAPPVSAGCPPAGTRAVSPGMPDSPALTFAKCSVLQSWPRPTIAKQTLLRSLRGLHLLPFSCFASRSAGGAGGAMEGARSRGQIRLQEIVRNHSERYENKRKTKGARSRGQIRLQEIVRNHSERYENKRKTKGKGLQSVRKRAIVMKTSGRSACFSQGCWPGSKPFASRPCATRQVAPGARRKPSTKPEEGSVPGSLRGYDAVRHGRRGRGGVL